jgi:hypothetical protein
MSSPEQQRRGNDEEGDYASDGHQRSFADDPEPKESRTDDEYQQREQKWHGCCPEQVTRESVSHQKI